jgi:hemolysin III
MQKTLREPVSSWIHLVSGVLAVFGLVLLVILGWGNLLKDTTLVVYGLTLILMFASSTIYHSVNTSDGVLLRLRKLDHSAIYLLIAGTYTPICLFFFTGFWKLPFLGIIWLFGLTGVLVKLFVINAPRWVTAGIYLVMGWLSIFAISEMIRSMPAGALIWLLAGGVCFTVGAAIYISKKLDFIPNVFGFHEVWHIFVTLGCLCHFILISVYIATA